MFVTKSVLSSLFLFLIIHCRCMKFNKCTVLRLLIDSGYFRQANNFILSSSPKQKKTTYEETSLIFMMLVLSFSLSLQPQSWSLVCPGANASGSVNKDNREPMSSEDQEMDSNIRFLNNICLKASVGTLTITRALALSSAISLALAQTTKYRCRLLY